MTTMTKRTPDQTIARLKKANKQLRSDLNIYEAKMLEYLDKLTEVMAELNQMKKERDEAAARDPLYSPLYKGARRDPVSLADLFWEVHSSCETIRGCQSLIKDYLLAPIGWEERDQCKTRDITKIISESLADAWQNLAFLVPNKSQDGRRFVEDFKSRDSLGRPLLRPKLNHEQISPIPLDERALEGLALVGKVGAE